MLQVNENPYLSLFWSRALLEQPKISMQDIIATIAQNQYGYVGAPTYEIVMVDSLLPQNPEKHMVEALDLHDKKRLNYCREMQSFEHHIPTDTSVLRLTL